MRYVVYHKDTTRYLCKHPKVRTDHESFASESAAKAALTREVKAGAVERQDFLIADATTFRTSIEKTETKCNLLTGKEFTQSVNTPMICDPSTETYWSA
jgi:hypothetical protein